ncbi:MAG: cytochrome c [Chlorobi bacterium]|nr:cytochrome c [Chlorobiota bacterium]
MKKKIKYESEINFKDLIKNPIRLFGLVFVYIFVVSLAIGVYYVWNLDYVTFNRIPGTPLDTLYKVREVETKVGTNQPSIDLALVKTPSKEMLAKAKEEFVKVCSACHGTSGEGNGPAGSALNPKPRNFHQKDGWKNGRAFGDLYKTIQEGLPGTAMVAYEYLPLDVKIGDSPIISVRLEIFLKLRTTTLRFWIWNTEFRRKSKKRVISQSKRLFQKSVPNLKTWKGILLKRLLTTKTIKVFSCCRNIRKTAKQRLPFLLKNIKAMKRWKISSPA